MYTWFEKSPLKIIYLIISNLTDFYRSMSHSTVSIQSIAVSSLRSVTMYLALVRKSYGDSANYSFVLSLVKTTLLPRMMNKKWKQPCCHAWWTNHRRKKEKMYFFSNKLSSNFPLRHFLFLNWEDVRRVQLERSIPRTPSRWKVRYLSDRENEEEAYCMPTSAYLVKLIFAIK